MGAREHAACGVGFVASTLGRASHEVLNRALAALACVEHRGGCLADGRTGDGAGIMTEVPFDVLGVEKGKVAVGTLFIGLASERRKQALGVFESIFGFLGLEVAGYRTVPVDTRVLGQQARDSLPTILQVFVRWPEFCRTESSFNALLYIAKQTLRRNLKRIGIVHEVHFASLSTSTIIYKALTRSEDLREFYPDLQNPAYQTRFAIFHRRFSTNTVTSWDKAQPFRMIAHNGEINTIECNRAWSYSREQALGLPPDELLTHGQISDSGNLNEMVEALRYRSSIPRLPEALAIMIPPASRQSTNYYKFWSRAVEPWDGPAFIAFSDGETVGARLDRNGFRPCRWAVTDDAFYLASEAGVFSLEEDGIIAKGALHGGQGAHVTLATGEIHFADPSESRELRDAVFDPRLERIGRRPPPEPRDCAELRAFGYSEEDVEQILKPMILTGKEPIGSMGDTARPAFLSDERRSFFDFFYQSFAQVTNPPLDHLRERAVTDLSTYLGRRPNVFAPKELIPLTPGMELPSPVIDLAEMEYLRRAGELSPNGENFECVEVSCTFPRVRGPKGLEEALEEIQRRVLSAVRGGCSILILSQREARASRPAIPSLLALRAAEVVLTKWGHRLDASIVVEAGDAWTTHHLAALVGFGAAAVCPYLAFDFARACADIPDAKLDPDRRERNLKRAYERGLLKVMSKMGISVVRGYQGSKLYSAVGLGPEILGRYFPGLSSSIGGLELEGLASRILEHTSEDGAEGLPIRFLFREDRRARRGEKHSMTSEMSRLLHRVTEEGSTDLDRWEDYERYLAAVGAAAPVHLRDLLDFAPSDPIPIEDVQPRDEILRRFGSGAMSFGAISAESQRDIIKAMAKVGARSASGEGGENPFYFVDGTTASIKQVASGRFGVTAEYLVVGQEIEIKVAQGAKPGEGGQLMAVKVDEEIARARHSLPHVDLISPPPLHDIYSIEDLRELIYELKQLKPGVRIAVKLVSGVNIGTIAAGVVKAGADVVQVSGGDGGTGAANLSSMRHAGLPWELGLVEVHHALVESGLRQHVVLRVDGGLQTGRDVVVAALLGAEEFGFGKLLLIGEGCIMARVCEKNTCPRGIATHDPKFKAKYRGTPERVVSLLTYLAEDVRRNLAQIGVSRLELLIGQSNRLAPSERHRQRIEDDGLKLGGLLELNGHTPIQRGSFLREGTSRLNQRLVEDAAPALDGEREVDLAYSIRSDDRAVLATLSGTIAERVARSRIGGELFSPKPIRIRFTGSAGQGFAVFMVDGLDVLLLGEANDSVAKSMSGGQLVIRPHPAARFPAEMNSIIGNCALYGATGGTLFVSGGAGDRFAVRNSGAVAVVEGVGLHACEYMTKGTVVVLGELSMNAGAGMTGGVLIVRKEYVAEVNSEYLSPRELEPEDLRELELLLGRYQQATGSARARRILDGDRLGSFLKMVPRSSARPQEEAEAPVEDSRWALER